MDPYRLLFPVGFVLGLIGSSLWLCFAFGAPIPYPGQLHAALMMGGFQLAVATGFLMTAAPRFTGTSSASKAELSGALVLGVAFVICSILAVPGWLPVFVVLSLVLALTVFLSGYFLRRFFSRTHSPPASFLFVGTGLFCGVGGSALLLLASWRETPRVAELGRLLLYHGMMLSFVLGVGSRLVTANLGWMQNPIIPLTDFQRKKPFWHSVRGTYGVALALSALFILSLLLEAFVSPVGGRLLRAGITSWMLLFTWKLYRWPRVRTSPAFWLWCSGWCVLAGVWLESLLPAYAVHAAHLMFIGGFSLMISVIAARMTLSHGGFDLGFETRSKVYRWFGGLILLAAALRVLAGFVPVSYYVGTLGAAALAFVTALLIWSFAFFGKIFRIRKERKA